MTELRTVPGAEHAKGDVPSYGLFIGGEWCAGALPSRPNLNPANGALLAHVAQADAEDARSAVTAAHQAFERVWGTSLASERESVLIRAADVVEHSAERFAGTLVAESGSTFPKAMFEMMYSVDLLRSAAGNVRHVFGETLPDTQPGQFGMTIRRPLGVIGGIAPFNAPFLLAMKKVAHALAAGNTFVLKPSEHTPMSGVMIAEVFEEAGLPPGVLNVVPGPAPEISQVLLEDPRVRMITFTGSTSVGRQLAIEAARNMKRITLELGGKNSMIVLADADLDYAARAAAFGGFFHQGQVCMATSRVLVEDPVYDEFCERLASIAGGIPVGDPSDPAMVIGPLIRPEQCEKIAKHVEDARDKGARVLTGGTAEGPFYQPTVVADVTSEMSIHDEELFGPVIAVSRVKDAEEALTVANESAYGLAAAVVTNDLQKALSLSFRLRAGMVHVNDCTVADEPHVPFGGTKLSGMGREGGLYSMQEMTELKWITVQLGERIFPL